jgi:hypothetical protein
MKGGWWRSAGGEGKGKDTDAEEGRRSKYTSVCDDSKMEPAIV